jgi:putative sigma-54 modulation protein
MFYVKPKIGGVFMDIRITGKNLEITEPLREYTIKKLNKLSHHFNQIVDVHVILEKVKQDRKEQHEASAHLVLPKGEIFADSIEDDMYASIDTLYSKLDTQVKKHKDKLKSRDNPPPQLSQ